MKEELLRIFRANPDMRFFPRELCVATKFRRDSLSKALTILVRQKEIRRHPSGTYSVVTTPVAPQTQPSIIG